MWKLKNDEDRAFLSEFSPSVSCAPPPQTPFQRLLPMVGGLGHCGPVPALQNPHSNPSHLSLVLKIHHRVFFCILQD